MARLHIYVDEKDGKARSKFGKPKDSDKIVFHNQHPSKTLEITVEGEPEAGSPLCQGDTEVDSFAVTATKKKEAFTICDAYEAETFKYTATIAGFVPEDPVIIIERGKLHSGSVPVLAAAALTVTAFVLGAVAARWMRRSRSSAPT